MATVSISKSSLNVVGGQQQSVTGTGTAQFTITTTSSQYAILSAYECDRAFTITIGSMTFVNSGSSVPFTMITGGIMIPPSTTVTMTSPGGGPVTMKWLYTLYGNT